MDVVIFTPKLYDVETSAPRLTPLIGPETVVITLQNGVETVGMVSRHVGAAHVAGGVAYVVAVVDEPGHVKHTTADRLVFGEGDGRPFRAAASLPGRRAAGRVHRRREREHRRGPLGEVRPVEHVERDDHGHPRQHGRHPGAR